MRKWCITIAVVAVAALAAAAYQVYRLSGGTRGDVQYAERLNEVPPAVGRLNALTARDIRWMHIRGYRHDEYMLAGITDADSVERVVAAAPQLSFSREAHAVPSGELPKVLRELDVKPSKGWSSGNWLIHGNLPDGSWIDFGFDPRTGEFWALLRVSHGNDGH